jgi:hypothetical protein
LKGAARAGALAFVTLIETLRARASEPVHELFGLLLEQSGYLEHLDATSEEDLDDRRRNVEELGAASAAFVAARAGAAASGAEADDVAERGSDLLAWLSECSLLTDADRTSEGDRVLLLTVHNAKGLEFDAVAVAGLEEGLMPHASSLETTAELEEERRLFYVALTRARDEVLLTAAAYRRRYDGARGAAVSRFVGEIPDTLLEREDSGGDGYASRSGTHGGARRSWHFRGSDDEVRDDAHDEAGAAHAAGGIPLVGSGRSASARRAVGRRVAHDTFGTGTVLEADGDGADLKLTVRFTGAIKKVFARVRDRHRRGGRWRLAAPRPRASPSWPRLHVDDSELDRLAIELSNVLDFAATLNELELSDEPLTRVRPGGFPAADRRPGRPHAGCPARDRERTRGGGGILPRAAGGRGSRALTAPETWRRSAGAIAEDVRAGRIAVEGAPRAGFEPPPRAGSATCTRS